MTKYTIKATVEVEMEFATPRDAISWVENHTIFDMIDNGAEYEITEARAKGEVTDRLIKFSKGTAQ